MNYCYFNGNFIPYDECKIHISDLQLQRGYGIFDYFRSKNGHIQWLDDYLDRFFNSISIADFEIDLTRENIKSILSDLQHKNGMDECGFKIMVTGGYSEDLGTYAGKPNVFVINIPYKKPNDKLYENGVNLVTCEYVRPFAEVKTLNYFTSLRLHKKIKEYKASDVLFHTDIISETSRGNIFCIKNGDIYTPGKNILNGITRKHTLRLFNSINVEDIKSESLFEFDEIFITSSAKDIMPVANIDGIKIGNGKAGKVTKDLMGAFKDFRAGT